MTQKRSKAFIILTHTYKPVTQGPDKGKVQVHESCQFVKYVKTKHLQSASVIMDVMNRILIKNAAREKGADYDDIEDHMIKGYANKYKLFLEAVGAEIPEALLMTKEEVKEELDQLKRVSDIHDELEEVSETYDELEKVETALEKNTSRGAK